MTAASRWAIEPFESALHTRDAFSCGYEAFDAYIRQCANQDVKRQVALVFVACSAGERVVKGYYTLSAASFRKDDLPAAQAKRLPHYPVPAAIIGRLAVDRTCQGQRLGAHLLMDCLDRILRASQLIAVHAVIADAKDEKAKTFYEKYGFKAFVNQPLRLFLPVATVAQIQTR
jgi:ribosomal protein S18 acetylase RimI-like enzyme